MSNYGTRAHAVDSNFLYEECEGLLMQSSDKARLIMGDKGSKIWFPKSVMRNFRLVDGGGNHCTFQALRSFLERKS